MSIFIKHMTKTLLSLLIGAALGAGVLTAINHSRVNNGETSATTSRSGAATITASKPYSGEINKNSYVNVADGSRSQVFSFAAQEGQLLNIQAKGALESRISVLRDGYLMASTDQQGGGFNLCESGSNVLLKQSRLFYEADRTGNIDIAVSGTGAYAYGPFELEVKLVEPPAGGAKDNKLVLDTPINAIATGKNQTYTLPVTQAGLYAIELNSCDFDGYLTITGNGVNQSDDDSSGNHYDPRILAWLEPGDYAIAASSSGGQTMRGQYSIHAKAEALPSGAEFQRSGALQAGKTVLSLVDPNSNASYSFTLQRPTEVVLTARSETVDVQLSLDNDENYWSDDDSGGGMRGTDAQIREMLPAGHYTVRLGGYGQGFAFLSLELRNQ
ncbi:hypothetical protein E9531_06015 [Lampropedia puyangensis]|uniref:Peptidase C-terminal archaeal/bacterial domain-containing protein n=1 Tax=Lampropedia puyangensis TaxID=1330072 RepID=A0A4V4GS36_9BURK|nr:hypothetical protein [Lampropedia puyangensis]THU03736.1 hypothetical protein E9531_06015 [Lampropedia puyangensis]